MSNHLLPPLFELLSTQYSQVNTAKTTLHGMNTYLASNGRNPSQMTPEERQQYQQQLEKRTMAGNIVADVLFTLEKFCQSMPLDWMFNTNANNQQQQQQQQGIDFIAALLHLLQEDTANIQVLAVSCLQQLSMRKLEQEQWFRLINALPSALFEASNASAQRASERGLPSPHCLEMLVEQLEFHKCVSKMGSTLVSAHLAHITADKDIVSIAGAWD